MTFSGFISFTTGAIAGTRMTTSNNLTLCQQNLLTKWAENGRLFVNYTLEREGWEAGWTVLYMTYNINTVTQSCYRTFNEFGTGIVE
jgi:hypothetical protein